MGARPSFLPCPPGKNSLMRFNITNAWIHSARKRCSASFLLVLNSESPKCTPGVGEDARGMGEGLKQRPILAFRSGSQRGNGETQPVLPTLGGVGCPYHGNG